MVVSESRMMSMGDNKEFFIPDISDIQTGEDDDAPLESQYTSKDIVKMEKNEMLVRRSAKYSAAAAAQPVPVPEPDAEPEADPE